MRHYSLDIPVAEQRSEEPLAQADAPISILKKYAKTLFNKCAENPDAPLTPMEQAKFDAAHAMMRDGKDTRYAFYKYKNEFEQPILESYRTVLNNHSIAAERSLNLSDQALRKVANFIDTLDQDKLALLKQDDAAYADFVAEAYMISHVRTGRSKTRRIETLLDSTLGVEAPETPEEQPAFNINTADLHALIEDNINGTLDTTEIAAEMTDFAEKMQQPLSELSTVIRGMPAAERQENGIQENCFFLFQKFIGVNTNSRRSIGAIGNMMSFMTACFGDHMPTMIDDLRAAKDAGDYHDFMGKYASPLIKTYQYLAPTGYLTQGTADVDEDTFIEFVRDMDAELAQVGQPRHAPNTFTADQRTVLSEPPMRYSRGPNARNLYTRFGPETNGSQPAAVFG